MKHFAANAQETELMWVDTIVDESTLNEIYYPAFKATIEAGTYSIMGAYNLLNGYHCCEHPDLLVTILRDKWKFDGVVISDWCAVHKTKEAANGALDIEMATTANFSEYYFANPLKKAIQMKEVEEIHIDKKVKNILRLMNRLKMIGSNHEDRKKGSYNGSASHDIVRNAAEESIVLLKNQKNRLPLDENKLHKIGVIGQNAMQLHADGGGRAQIKAFYEISPLLGLKILLGGRVDISYVPGYYIPDKDDTDQVIEEKQRQYLQEAIQIASQCEQTIFIGGLNHEQDVEGLDRNHLKLPYSQDLCIEAILRINPKAIIVLIGGAPVEMPWKERASAIVWSYYAGMEGGIGLAKVLLGKVNPSGKLPETFPERYEDCAVAKSGQFAKK
ncbi:MAG: glycoside hydrolase family 3 protein, partial [Clostridiales bacterium]|nr:glycoside hydrolase family 3 protein [Clostridiales bacterium]